MARKKKQPGEHREPIGRPPFEITKAVLKKVERLAAKGLAEYQIAYSIGIHPDTFIEKKKTFPDFSEAVRRGKARGVKIISNALFRTALGGHFPAQKYYLNNRAPDDWAEVKAIEHSGIVEHIHVSEKTEEELATDIEAAKQRLRDSGISLIGESKAKTVQNKSPVVHRVHAAQVGSGKATPDNL